MRRIFEIIIHCSDSDYLQHDNVSTIKDWHVKERGWSDIGYHYIITKANSGKIHFGRAILKPGAHVKGRNSNSIGICLTGKTKFTDNQITSLVSLCVNLIQIFDLDPIDIRGHYEMSNNGGKTCPNLDMIQIRELINKELDLCL